MKIRNYKKYLFVISLLCLFGLPLISAIAAGCCRNNNTGQCVSGFTQSNCEYTSGTGFTSRSWIEPGHCDESGQCVADVTQFVPPPATPPLTLKLQIPIPGLAQTITIDGDTIGTYISAVYKFFVGALAIIAVVMIMIGGFQWLMAAGSAEKVSHAKETIFGAIIGLVLALTSYLLLYTLNPNLVQYQSLIVNDVNPVDITPSNWPTDCTQELQSPVHLTENFLTPGNENQCEYWLSQCQNVQGCQGANGENYVYDMTVFYSGAELFGETFICCKCGDVEQPYLCSGQ